MTKGLFLSIAAAALLAFAGTASATGGSHVCQGNADCSTTNNTATGGAGGAGGAGGTGIGVSSSKSKASSNASAVANQSQGQFQQQGQEQRVRQNVKQTTKQANQQDTHVSVDAGGGDVPRQAPSMFLGGSVSNTTCMAHVGGGVSMPLGGAQILVPKLDDGCDSRAWVIILQGRGYHQEAEELMKQTSKVDKAFKSAEEKRNRGSASIPNVQPSSAYVPTVQPAPAMGTFPARFQAAPVTPAPITQGQ